jgi:Sigma-70, region 4
VAPGSPVTAHRPARRTNGCDARPWRAACRERNGTGVAGAAHRVAPPAHHPMPEGRAAVDVAGLSYREAAKVLKTREGTVMSRLYRARNQVAAQLDG